MESAMIGSATSGCPLAAFSHPHLPHILSRLPRLFEYWPSAKDRYSASEVGAKLAGV